VSKIYIVHGRGSGQLRKGVHEYLKNQAFVKSFRVAENSEGGQAITVVEL
jgi:DNA mismatch repair protein MutS2